MAARTESQDLPASVEIQDSAASTNDFIEDICKGARRYDVNCFIFIFVHFRRIYDAVVFHNLTTIVSLCQDYECNIKYIMSVDVLLFKKGTWFA